MKKKQNTNGLIFSHQSACKKLEVRRLESATTRARVVEEEGWRLRGNAKRSTDRPRKEKKSIETTQPTRNTRQARPPRSLIEGVG